MKNQATAVGGFFPYIKQVFNLKKKIQQMAGLYLMQDRALLR